MANPVGVATTRITSQRKDMMVQTNNTRVKVPNLTTPRPGTCSQESDDDLSPKPKGRGKSDGSDCKKGKRFIHCRNKVKIATMNVTTIRKQALREELACNLNKYGIDILGIQEHRIIHDEPVRWENIQGSNLITLTAYRNTQGSSIGGVGIIISKKATESLAKVGNISKQILVANFEGGNFPTTTVIVNYSPTNEAEEKDIEEHYKNLRAAINSVPTHNVLLVVGDFNARVGNDDVKFSYHENTNRNGQYLLDLVLDHNLTITNTNFQKAKGKLWTHISPMGLKFQLDYILIRKKWRNSVRDAEAYNTFASIGSNHRIVTAFVRLSLRKAKTVRRKKTFDWSILRNKDIQDRYTIEVKNRFSALEEKETEEEGIEEEQNKQTRQFQNFIKVNNEVAERMIPAKKRVRRSRYEKEPEVCRARDEINRTYEDYQKHPRDENKRQKYKEAKKDLRDTYEDAFEKDMREKVRRIEDAHINCKHKESWKLINEVSGRRAPKKGQIQGRTQKERLNNWFDHFQKLLGSPPQIDSDGEDGIHQIFEELDIHDGNFTMNEYQEVKKLLPVGKSCGEDNIPTEVLKYCNLDEIILDFCNRALQSGETPEQWSILNIIPIPKSGDLSKVENYRGISLNSIVAKIYNKMLLKRIRPVIDKLLRSNQNGFRPGRSTVSHILALRRIIEGVKEYQLPAIITFIDFSKAFDSIHRDRMFNILRAYGIPDKLVNAVQAVYRNTKAKVITPDGETAQFDIEAGVLQGDTLAPYLFVIVLDYALRQAINGKEEELGFKLDRRRSRRVGPEIIIDLDFADDIALLSEEIHQAQEVLDRIVKSAGGVGLKINAKKTKFMSYSQQSPQSVLTTGGTQLKCVNDFKYLGSYVGSTEKDVKARKAAAWNACNKLTKIWKSSLPRRLKEQIFISTVETVLIYGCETWTVTPKIAKSLDGCYTRLLRAAFNIHWSLHITNKVLYGNMERLTDKIRFRRMRFAGHCYRGAEQVAKTLLWQPKHGKRKRGRRTLNYINVLCEDTGLEVNDLPAVMENRTHWKTIITRDRIMARLK